MRATAKLEDGVPVGLIHPAETEAFKEHCTGSDVGHPHRDMAHGDRRTC
jgi:hypothetical protein